MLLFTPDLHRVWVDAELHKGEIVYLEYHMLYRAVAMVSEALRLLIQVSQQATP